MKFTISFWAIRGSLENTRAKVSHTPAFTRTESNLSILLMLLHRLKVWGNGKVLMEEEVLKFETVFIDFWGGRGKKLCSFHDENLIVHCLLK
jgi:hypothetical protein